MKLLRKISLLVSLALIGVVTKAADYEVTAADISVTEGEAATLAIELKNAGEAVGFQCDITLPEGVKISGAMTMLRHQEGVHTLVTKEQEGGAMRVLVYSNPNTAFTGNSGVVLNVPLSVDVPLGDYSIKLQNAVATASGAKAYYMDDSEIVLTVEPVYVQSVVLDNSTLELHVGESSKLNATVLPENATDKSVTWTSSNNSVATVDTNGNVTAVSLGTATITAKSGDVTAGCEVKVLPIAVSSVTLNKTSLELAVGGSEQLSATVLPENATDKSVTWTSSDKKVATVDANGNVKAISAGTATIMAKSGDVTTSCEVTVYTVPASSVTLNKSTLELAIGGSEQLSATVLPENTTDKSVTWASSDNSIATVDTNGNVTAVSVGSGTITVSCGEVTANCEVTVITIAASSVTLDKSTLELIVGSSDKLTATVSPANTTDKSVKWTSSDASVVAVNASGRIVAKAAGTATITATCGEATASCKVTVLPVAVTSVTLNKTSMSLTMGGSGQLTATVSPTNATDKSVTWTSSDKSIATVDANGKVTPVSAGTATITATCGGKTASCKVTVSKKSQTITWNQTFANIVEGDVVELNATASSGLNVVYKVLEGDATIQGNKLTVNAAGTIRVEASQSGDKEFDVAKVVEKTINVTADRIDEIRVDAEKARYFDLTGRPVENPKHGIYIKVEGGKSAKVML